MIKGEYGEEELMWCLGEVGLRKSIMKEQSSLLSCFSFVVGNGRRVNSYVNKW